MDTVYIRTNDDGNMEVKYAESHGFEPKEIPPGKLEEIKTVVIEKLQDLLKSL